MNRIVTHTDFDGICSAVLLKHVFGIDEVAFAEPWELSRGQFLCEPGDVVADLPLPKEGCAAWYDHHEPAQAIPEVPSYHVDPSQRSCAGFIFRLHDSVDGMERFVQLVAAADKIDSAQFSREDLLEPDAFGKIAMSLTRRPDDDDYRLHLIGLLSALDPEEVLEDPHVRARYAEQRKEEEFMRKAMRPYTRVEGRVIVTDLSASEKDFPGGSPFWLYLDHPGAQFSLKLRRDEKRPDMILVAIGKNIFTKKSEFDLSALMREFGGGGHRDAAGCTIPFLERETVVKRILETLNNSQ